MRILSVTQSYAPFYEFGGPPVKVEALATGLASRGHQVTVVTADWGIEKRIAKNATAVTARRSTFGWERIKDGVNSVYLPTWLRYRALSWNPALARFCQTRIKEFDSVHIFGLYDLLGSQVASACQRNGIPYVVEPMGMFVPIVRSIFLKRLYHATLGKRMLKEAAGIIATAEQEAMELAAGGVPHAKIILRRNGVMAPRNLPKRGSFRARHGLASDATVVLFLGRLSAKKSPELMLQSFAQLPYEVPGQAAWLVFAGPDESGMRGRLEKLAGELGLAARVLFAGPLYGDEKWAAYRDADVFVLPSQNENFGNTALEAAACGTPVVITETCGVAPLLADTAGIVVPHEPGAVARAVKSLLTDAKLHARLSEGGKLAAGRLGWDEPVRAMEQIYDRLAAHRPPVGQSASQT